VNAAKFTSVNFAMSAGANKVMSVVVANFIAGTAVVVVAMIKTSKN
jgi:hypothetical protein